MDPVNKWITVVILFMAAVLYVGWSAGGSGRYELAVEKSTVFENHAVVYVLDTKDGDVRAQLVDENDLHYQNRPRNTPKEIFSMPGYTTRRY